MAEAWHLIQSTASLGSVTKSACVIHMKRRAYISDAGLPVLVCHSLEVQPVCWRADPPWP